MHLFDILVLTVALGIGLAIARFVMLAFLPAHPMSQFMTRLDEIFDRGR